MALDEAPIDRSREQRVEMAVARLRVRALERDVVPGPHAGHETDTEQVGQSKHRL